MVDKDNIMCQISIKINQGGQGGKGATTKADEELEAKDENEHSPQSKHRKDLSQLNTVSE